MSKFCTITEPLYSQAGCRLQAVIVCTLRDSERALDCLPLHPLCPSKRITVLASYDTKIRPSAPDRLGKCTRCFQGGHFLRARFSEECLAPLPPEPQQLQPCKGRCRLAEVAEWNEVVWPALNENSILESDSAIELLPLHDHTFILSYLACVRGIESKFRPGQGENSRRHLVIILRTFARIQWTCFVRDMSENSMRMGQISSTMRHTAGGVLSFHWILRTDGRFC